MLILRLVKTEDAIKEFESPLGLATALGITRAAIYQWGDTVPPLRAYQIRELLARRRTGFSSDTATEPHQEAA